MFSPGRVNLIGEHTDYTGGRALPMAIQLGTTITGRRHDDRIELSSNGATGTAELTLPLLDDPAEWLEVNADQDPWFRFVRCAAVALPNPRGLVGSVSSDLPIGAGLSSSSSLTVALLLALGSAAPPEELAALALSVEDAATGIRGGLMDQLCIAGSVPGHALSVDFTTLERQPIPLPPAARILVVDSGQRRQLGHSAYDQRRRECEAAAATVGPLPQATPADVAELPDETLRRRARHVVSENLRVDQFAEALRRDDLVSAGELLSASHRSLRDDFEVSTDTLDQLVDQLEAHPGVRGARLTGAGFGGCAVALVDRAGPEPTLDVPHWWVEPAGPARVISLGQ